MKKVVIHTDGACEGNPGPGGWAAILRYGAHAKELCGGEPATTNNRMELTAAIEALRAIKEPCDVQLFTDSEYLRDGITSWVASVSPLRTRTYGAHSMRFALATKSSGTGSRATPVILTTSVATN